jgi:hypothetical protein
MRVVEEFPDRLMACKGIKEAEDAMAQDVGTCSDSQARASGRQHPTNTIEHQAEALRSASA